MRLYALLVAAAFLVVPHSASAAPSQGSRYANGIVTPITFQVPFDTVGGLASADLGTDGIRELVMSAGAGAEPRVAILRQDGSILREFLAYGANYRGGVSVAVGDVVGDDTVEIVTGTMMGGGPHVRVFDASGNVLGQFFAYDPGFRGGVNVALGDIDGDGRDDIVTAPGITGGPHVRVFDQSGARKNEVFVFDASDRAGLSITTTDADHDGRAEIIAAHQGASLPEARRIVFDALGTPTLEEPFRLYGTSYHHGATLFPVDRTTVGVTPNGHGGPHVRQFSAEAQPVFDWFAYEANVRDRVLATAVTPRHLITVRTAPLIAERLDKHIRVDLSEQHLYAAQDGLTVQHFPISGARWPFTTPTGTFSVLRKLPIHDYVWTYGIGDPRNYALRDVEFNLEFTPHYYIHYAYWHNNFGRPMSHGCVNAPYEEIKQLYAWADVGTPVIIES